jgi:hypothetical protein
MKSVTSVVLISVSVIVKMPISSRGNFSGLVLGLSLMVMVNGRRNVVLRRCSIWWRKWMLLWSSGVEWWVRRVIGNVLCGVWVIRDGVMEICGMVWWWILVP